MVDPSLWIGEFIIRHSARHPAIPWPDPDENPESYDILIEAWLGHLRSRRATEAMAERTSKALMLIPHYPNNHAAEFFKAMPEAPPECVRPDPALIAHYAKGDVILRERRQAEVEARERRTVNFEANRKAALEAIAARRGVSS